MTCGLPGCNAPVEEVVDGVTIWQVFSHDRVDGDALYHARSGDLPLCQEHYDRLGLLEDEAARDLEPELPGPFTDLAVAP